MFHLFARKHSDSTTPANKNLPPLKDALIEKVKKEYLELPIYRNLVAYVGPGLQRATAYIEKQLQPHTGADWILFDQVLSDIQSDQSALGSSKKLRAVLAEGLCEHLGISKETLESKMSAKHFLAKIGDLAQYRDAVKVAAALELIKQKQQDGIELKELPPTLCTKPAL